MTRAAIGGGAKGGRAPRVRGALALLLLAVLVGTLPLADVVVLDDGRRIEGEVVRKSAKEVVVRTATGEVSFPRAKVVEIIERKGREEEYRERLEACETGEDFYQLGRWCREKKQRRRAGKMFERAIEVDPDHAAARAELGFVRHDGKWMSVEERDRALAAAYEAEMREKGFVRYEGRWVSPEQKEHFERGEVLHEGRWLPEAEAKRLQGLESFDGAWLPIPEARGRHAAEGAATAAGRKLLYVLSEEALVCGTVPEPELREIALALPRGREWFDATWGIETARDGKGVALFGDQLAEFYVFDDHESYQATIPYLAARSRHIPRGWAEAVKNTHGFTWTDPLALSSVSQRGRRREDLVGHCYHHLGHLLLNRHQYDGKLLPPWYDEGVASLVELRIHGKNAVFCRTGVAEGAGSASGGSRVRFDRKLFRDGSWRTRFAEAVRAEQIGPFDRLAQREFSQLDLVDVAASMAIVEWLESRGDGALERFHRALRRGAPPAPLRVIVAGVKRHAYFDAAFRAAVGMDHEQADHAWRKWFVNR